MSMNDRYNEFFEFRSNPANDHTTDGMWCGTNGIQPSEFQEFKARNPGLFTKILEKRRTLYADELIKVDQALLTKARTGDVQAAKLLWARFENWSPKIEEENVKQTGVGKQKTLAELISESQ